MKYVCTEDIENLAAQGKKELIVDENTVVMDLASDMARQLGIAIVDGSHSTLAKAASPAAAAAPAKPAATAAPAKLATTPNGTAPSLAAKPKGCQHGMLTVAGRQEHSNGHQNSDGVVDQLVDFVRQSVGKRSGN